MKRTTRLLNYYYYYSSPHMHLCDDVPEQRACVVNLRPGLGLRTVQAMRIRA